MTVVIIGAADRQDATRQLSKALAELLWTPGAECVAVHVQDLHLPPQQRLVLLEHWLRSDAGYFTSHGLRFGEAQLRELIADLTAALGQLQP